MDNFNNQNKTSNMYTIIDWDKEEQSILDDMKKLDEITKAVISKRVPDIKVDSDPVNEKVNYFNKAVNQYKIDEQNDMNRLNEVRQKEHYTNKVNQVNSYMESSQFKAELAVPKQNETEGE